MRANGVSPDPRTRALVDDVRREIGTRTLWLEESERGSGDVWGILGEIERLVARPASKGTSTNNNRRPPTPHDAWKNPELTADNDAGYHFGEWPDPESRRPARRRTSQSS